MAYTPNRVESRRGAAPARRDSSSRHVQSPFAAWWTFRVRRDRSMLGRRVHAHMRRHRWGACARNPAFHHAAHASVQSPSSIARQQHQQRKNQQRNNPSQIAIHAHAHVHVHVHGTAARQWHSTVGPSGALASSALTSSYSVASIRVSSPLLVESARGDTPSLSPPSAAAAVATSGCRTGQSPTPGMPGSCVGMRKRKPFCCGGERARTLP
mmetsp:Transcript_17028/g.46183  ORF Transcript_17028/g.46183 Transcript_17028/m.46183 type:complete len:211 (-) Transcript_17028:42-674(-)